MPFDGVNDAEREKQQEKSETSPQQQHDADTTMVTLVRWQWRRVSAATPPRRRQVLGQRKPGYQAFMSGHTAEEQKKNRAIAGTVCGINVSGLRFCQSVIR